MSGRSPRGARGPLRLSAVPTLALALAGLLAGCGAEHGARAPLDADPLLPPPPAPALEGVADADALLELGRALFHEPRLSLDGRRSCATCHVPWRAFSGRPVRELDGTRVDVPPLVGAARRARLGWQGQWESLIDAVAHPFGDVDGFGGSLLGLSRAFAPESALSEQHARAFGRPVPDEAGALIADVAGALAAFVAALDDGGSAFDRAVDDPEGEPLAADARRGWELFRAEGCTRCHPTPTFTDGALRRQGLAPTPADEREPVDLDDPLVALEAGVAVDDGEPAAYRTPSLRDVTRTAPYMHDGRLATLDDVLDHYSAGTRGRQGPSGLRALDLTPRQRADLTAFLASLEVPSPPLALLGAPPGSAPESGSRPARAAAGPDARPDAERRPERERARRDDPDARRRPGVRRGEAGRPAAGGRRGDGRAGDGGGGGAAPDPSAGPGANPGAAAQGGRPRPGTPPPDAGAPASGEAPVGSDAPAPGEAPAGSDAPASGEAPVGSDAPASGEAPVGSDAPASGEAPVGSDAPASGEAPVGSDAPASGEAPVGSDAPATGQAPAGSDAPATGEAPYGSETSGPGEDPAPVGASPFGGR